MAKFKVDLRYSAEYSTTVVVEARDIESAQELLEYADGDYMESLLHWKTIDWQMPHVIDINPTEDCAVCQKLMDHCFNEKRQSVARRNRG